MHKKILLLGSGELGKELVISLKRLGQTVIAADSYEGAPAMQVADGFVVIDMLNGNDLFHIYSNMDIEPEQNDKKANELKSAFNAFKQKNAQFIKGAKLIPDSLYNRY